MSDSVWPHTRQPTRLLCPWDSPGKNTGVGCHFLLQCMKVKSESEIAQSSPTLSDPMDYSLPGSSVHGIFQARVLEWVAVAFSKFVAVGTNYFKMLIYLLLLSFILIFSWIGHGNKNAGLNHIMFQEPLTLHHNDLQPNRSKLRVVSKGETLIYIKLVL